MRSFSADAAIVAVPSLAAAAGAVWAGEHLFAAAPAELIASHPLVPFPVYAAIAFLLTWAVYFLVAGLLHYRALSTSNAFSIYMLLAGLILALLLLSQPAAAPPLVAAAAGGALALRLVRRRPSRRYSAN